MNVLQGFPCIYAENLARISMTTDPNIPAEFLPEMKVDAVAVVNLGCRP